MHDTHRDSPNIKLSRYLDKYRISVQKERNKKAEGNQGQKESKRYIDKRDRIKKGNQGNEIRKKQM